MPQVVYQREFLAASTVLCGDGTVATGVDIPGESTLEYDDGGQAMILHPWETEDEGLFVRIHSWQEGAARQQPGAHADMHKLLGKRVRVTVEVLD